jgi:hypothetical protein
MTDYHFHHPEKMFTDRAELLEIIRGQRLMTLAMAKNGQPYLITVNYGFDAEQGCFYFHIIRVLYGWLLWLIIRKVNIFTFR